jgi:hypothetical protein
VAVHHFTAPDLVIAVGGWQPMDSFPKDGTIVEVIDSKGVTCNAQWHSERILTSSLSISEPTQWRPRE